MVAADDLDVNPVAWSELATLPANATSYADAGLVSGTAYRYLVEARNAAGSAFSDSIAATTWTAVDVWRLNRLGQSENAGFAADDLDGSWRPYRAIGCSACNNGYRGRVGLYQVMPITEAVQRIILAQGNAIDIAEQARRDGVRDLRQAGLLKVRNGVTTLEEVISVTNQ